MILEYLNVFLLLIHVQLLKLNNITAEDLNKGKIDYNITAAYYINTSEIPGELSHENMI